jgi:hypothetical protein
MPLQNIYLENEGQEMTADERRDSWNSEPILKDAPSENEPEQLELAHALTGLVTNFIKEEWINETNLEPKEELGLMFTVHKRILQEILNQSDCEGVRIFISSATSENIKTSIVVKPVDHRLDELDKVFPERTIKFCKKLTECPPENKCPSKSFDTFKDVLKARLNRQ